MKNSKKTDISTNLKYLHTWKYFGQKEDWSREKLMYGSTSIPT
jgi:hypothetical protein